MDDAKCESRLDTDCVSGGEHRVVGRGDLSGPTKSNNGIINLTEFFYMYLTIMVGPDDGYLRVYGQTSYSLTYNKLTRGEMYIASQVDKKSHDIVAKKLKRWRYLYLKYSTYLARGLHDYVCNAPRFDNYKIIVQKYMNMYVAQNHQALGPCIVNHATFKDKKGYAAGLYDLTLWFNKPCEVFVMISIECINDGIYHVFHESYTSDDMNYEEPVWVLNCFAWKSNPIVTLSHNLARIVITVDGAMPEYVISRIGYSILHIDNGPVSDCSVTNDDVDTGAINAINDVDTDAVDAIDADDKLSSGVTDTDIDNTDNADNADVGADSAVSDDTDVKYIPLESFINSIQDVAESEDNDNNIDTQSENSAAVTNSMNDDETVSFSGMDAIESPGAIFISSSINPRFKKYTSKPITQYKYRTVGCLSHRDTFKLKLIHNNYKMDNDNILSNYHGVVTAASLNVTAELTSPHHTLLMDTLLSEMIARAT